MALAACRGASVGRQNPSARAARPPAHAKPGIVGHTGHAPAPGSLNVPLKHSSQWRPVLYLPAAHRAHSLVEKSRGRPKPGLQPR